LLNLFFDGRLIAEIDAEILKIIIP
jgi:hypothetical protein